MTPEGDLGQRPHPNTMPCADCGHVWFEGERRHEYVDAAGTVTIEDDAEAVCVLCRRKRGRPRPSDGEGYVTHW
jgi:hypothetical protein